MSIKPDWSKAPEGATHYCCTDRHTPWRKVEAPDRAFWWDGQRWEPVHGFRRPLPAEYVTIHAAGPAQRDQLSAYAELAKVGDA